MINKNKEKQDIIIITGPTASGKSDYAVELALNIKDGKSDVNNYVKKECVIISADSRQIYKDLDIGSGKITESEMKGVLHYGLGIAQPIENFTAVDWLKYAEEKIIEITNENKIPIICGGTGLYIDALLYGITDNPAPDEDFRLAYKNKTLPQIQEEIKSINLIYFNNLNNSEQNNKNRLIRKLEILIKNQRNTGDGWSSKTITGLASAPNQDHSRVLKYNILSFIILSPELSILENRIKVRLEKRLEENNLIIEVKNLLEKNIYTKERLISFGLEYRYLTQYILGEISYEEMYKTLLFKIIKYAKRQIVWNKRYEDIKKSIPYVII